MRGHGRFLEPSSCVSCICFDHQRPGSGCDLRSFFARFLWGQCIGPQIVAYSCPFSTSTNHHQATAHHNTSIPQQFERLVHCYETHKDMQERVNAYYFHIISIFPSISQQPLPDDRDLFWVISECHIWFGHGIEPLQSLPRGAGREHHRHSDAHRVLEKGRVVRGVLLLLIDQRKLGSNLPSYGLLLFKWLHITIHRITVHHVTIHQRRVVWDFT